MKPNLEFCLDKFLCFLADGERHRLKESAEAIRISEDRVEEIVKFLSRFNFVQFDEADKKAMINFELRKLIVCDP